MGIENRGHRQGLMVAINALPVEELFEEVPVSIIFNITAVFILKYPYVNFHASCRKSRVLFVFDTNNLEYNRLLLLGNVSGRIYV